MHSAKYAEMHAELAAELERPSPMLAKEKSHAEPRRTRGTKPAPHLRVKALAYRGHSLPADYLTAEQVRALDRPGTAAEAPVENAAGPLVKEPYWIE